MINWRERLQKVRILAEDEESGKSLPAWQRTIVAMDECADDGVEAQ
jgi:hypothetical protein